MKGKGNKILNKTHLVFFTKTNIDRNQTEIHPNLTDERCMI